MENTQGVWILHVIVLSLIFLTDNEQVITAKKHLIKKAARLSQLIYF